MKKHLWEITSGVLLLCLAFAVLIIVKMWHIQSRYEHRSMLNDKYGYYNTNDEAYIYDITTNENVLTNVLLISENQQGDSICVFVWKDEASKPNRKRGYLNINTAQIIVEPKFDAAWIFSEGVAAVCENDSVYFINTAGQPISNLKFKRKIDETYLFKDDYCIVKTGNNRYGVVNHSGEWEIAPIWDYIEWSDRFTDFLVYSKATAYASDKSDDNYLNYPMIPYRGKSEAVDTIYIRKVFPAK